MAIKNKFIHFNTEAGFKNYLLTGNGSGGGFLNTEGTNFEENIYSVKPEKQEDWNLFKNYTCFIKDTQRIWTHEKFYNCNTSNYFNINRGEITDANNINNIGMYTFTSDTQNIPSEMSGSGIILTYASTVSPDNFIQMCTGFKNGTPTSWYIRSKTGTNDWSNWSKLLDDRNLTKLSQLEDDIVNGKYLPIDGTAIKAEQDSDGNIIKNNYFKLLPDKVTDLNDVPVNSFFVSSQGTANSPASSAFFVNGFCIAADNSSIFKKQLVYADDWYVRSQVNGTWGGWNKLWHSGNLNPVTLDTSQRISGLKHFISSIPLGLNTTGKIGSDSEFSTSIAFHPNDQSSYWLIQYEDDITMLLGTLFNKAVKFRTEANKSVVIADEFTGTATQIQDSSDNSSKKIWTGTQSEYNAILSKDANTIYLITE